MKSFNRDLSRNDSLHQENNFLKFGEKEKANKSMQYNDNKSPAAQPEFRSHSSMLSPYSQQNYWTNVMFLNKLKEKDKRLENKMPLSHSVVKSCKNSIKDIKFQNHKVNIK